MNLGNRARDYDIVYELYFDKKSVLNNGDLSIHGEFDITSEEGGGETWLVEHLPTNAVFTISYYNDQEREDSVRWLTTWNSPDKENFQVNKLAILNEEHD